MQIKYYLILHRCFFSTQFLEESIELYVTKICQKQNIHYCSYVFFVFVFSRSEFKKYFNALDILDDEKRSHIAILNLIQRFGSCNIYNKRKRISAFIIDETII